MSTCCTALLLGIDGPCVGLRLKLSDNGPQTIGRGSAVHLRIDDSSLSGEHACLTWKRAAWQLEDLGSRNGTRLNGQPVHDGVLLRDGDRVQIGNNVLELVDLRAHIVQPDANVQSTKLETSRHVACADAGAAASDAIALPTQPLVPAHATASPAFLEVVQGSARGLLLPLAAEVGQRIGRCSAAQLRIADRSISRNHASIRYAGERWELQDLGSRNGTRVNGRRVDGIVAMHAGDLIEVGSTFLKLVSPTTPNLPTNEQVDADGEFVGFMEQLDALRAVDDDVVAASLTARAAFVGEGSCEVDADNVETTHGEFAAVQEATLAIAHADAGEAPPSSPPQARARLIGVPGPLVLVRQMLSARVPGVRAMTSGCVAALLWPVRLPRRPRHAGAWMSLVGGGFTLALLVTLPVFLLHHKQRPAMSAPPPLAWFYDLKQERLFAAEAELIAPIRTPWQNDASGKAHGMRAYVFSCGECDDRESQFIGFLEQFGEEARAVAVTADYRNARMPLYLPDVMIASREDPSWVPRYSREGGAILRALKLRCESASALKECTPTQADLP